MDKNTLSSALKGKGSSIRIGDIEISKEYLKKKGYEAKKLLGVGGCGVVLEAMNIKTQQRVAIKLILVEHKGEASSCIEEVSLMSQIKSPHVIKALEHFLDEDNSMFYILLEFGEKGDLENYVLQNPNMPAEQIIRVFSAILQGIIDIQQIGIIHGDLKPLNVVLNSEGKALLTDFGLSKKLVGNLSKVTYKGSTMPYSPPEQDDGKLVPQSDYYSAGMVLLFLCRNKTSIQEMVKIKFGIFPEDIQKSANQLIQVATQMLSQAPKERMHPREALTVLGFIEKQKQSRK